MINILKSPFQNFKNAGSELSSQDHVCHGNIALEDVGENCWKV